MPFGIVSKKIQTDQRFIKGTEGWGHAKQMTERLDEKKGILCTYLRLYLQQCRIRHSILTSNFAGEDLASLRFARPLLIFPTY